MSSVVLQRKIIKKSEFDLLKMRKDALVLECDYADLRVTEFSNRTEDILNIMKLCNDLKTIKIMIVARTQSGKTYVLLQIVKNLVIQQQIPIGNIYIITGLSSLDWKEQTQKRFPECFRKNILHLNDIEKDSFVTDLRRKRDVRIIIDETQIACRKKQTLYKQFDKIGLRDFSYLYENNIQIIETSATPSGTLVDMKDNEYLNKVKGNNFYTLTKLDDYLGLEELSASNRLLDAVGLYQSSIHKKLEKINETFKKGKQDTGDLYSVEDRDEIQNFINDLLGEYYHGGKLYEQKEFLDTITNSMSHCFPPQVLNQFWRYYTREIEINNSLIDVKGHEQKFGGKSYIIIRTPNGDKQDRVVSKGIQRVFPDGEYDYRYYDKKIDNFDLEDLKKQPQKTTIVCIKEKFRCSHTLIKDYISVVYERIPETGNDDTNNQGLVGRMTGYNDNGITIVYGCLDSCKKLLAMETNNYDMRGFSSASLNTRGKSKGTYNQDSEDAGGSKCTQRDTHETGYQFGLKTATEVTEFCKSKFGVNYKPMRKPDTDGFYKRTYKGKREISTEAVILETGHRSQRTTGSTRSCHMNNIFALPYYTDTTDPSTLLWAVLFRAED